MAVDPKTDSKVDVDICGSPVALRQFLSTLLDALHLQAKEIERLTSHVEQNTDSMLTPSQMPVVVSELSALRARLDRPGTGKS